MKVIIDEDFYIEITEFNHTLINNYLSEDDNGDLIERKRTIGYYGSVQQCLRELVRLKVREAEDVVSLGGYVVLLEEAIVDLAYLLEEHLGGEEEIR